MLRCSLSAKEGKMLDMIAEELILKESQTSFFAPWTREKTIKIKMKTTVIVNMIGKRSSMVGIS
jgi:hypothetical protein